MTKNLDTTGLKSIAKGYDLFFIDLWGVIHNGIKLYGSAIETLIEIESLNKEYVLLTNAPRPNNTVKKFLMNMGMDKNILKKVYSSGEAALSYLKKNYIHETFYHIGPPRDFDLFLDFNKNKIEDINKCSYLLCTGLFDKYDKDLNYYKSLLEDKTLNEIALVGNEFGTTTVRPGFVLNFACQKFSKKSFISLSSTL